MPGSTRLSSATSTRLWWRESGGQKNDSRDAYGLWIPHHAAHQLLHVFIGDTTAEALFAGIAHHRAGNGKTHGPEFALVRIDGASGDALLSSRPGKASQPSGKSQDGGKAQHGGASKPSGKPQGGSKAQQGGKSQRGSSKYGGGAAKGKSGKGR